MDDLSTLFCANCGKPFDKKWDEWHGEGQYRCPYCQILNYLVIPTEEEEAPVEEVTPVTEEGSEAYLSAKAQIEALRLAMPKELSIDKAEELEEISSLIEENLSALSDDDRDKIESEYLDVLGIIYEKLPALLEAKDSIAEFFKDDDHKRMAKILIPRKQGKWIEKAQKKKAEIEKAIEDYDVPADKVKHLEILNEVLTALEIEAGVKIAEEPKPEPVPAPTPSPRRVPTPPRAIRASRLSFLGILSAIGKTIASISGALFALLGIAFVVLIYLNILVGPISLIMMFSCSGLALIHLIVTTLLPLDKIYPAYTWRRSFENAFRGASRILCLILALAQAFLAFPFLSMLFRGEIHNQLPYLYDYINFGLFLVLFCFLTVNFYAQEDPISEHVGGLAYIIIRLSLIVPAVFSAICIGASLPSSPVGFSYQFMGNAEMLGYTYAYDPNTNIQTLSGFDYFSAFFSLPLPLIISTFAGLAFTIAWSAIHHFIDFAFYQPPKAYVVIPSIIISIVGFAFALYGLTSLLLSLAVLVLIGINYVTFGIGNMFSSMASGTAIQLGNLVFADNALAFNSIFGAVFLLLGIFIMITNIAEAKEVAAA